MTQKEKQLLLQDLCARLPYGVKCLTFDNQVAITGKLCSFSELVDSSILFGLTDKTYDAPNKYYQPQAMFKYETIKPYLRPIKNMTEKEIEKMWNIWENGAASEVASKITDFLNEEHLDHHHLIEKGLALEAPEGMYNI